MDWLKDKTHYRSKYNTVKIELKVQRDAFATATLEWARQLEEKEAGLQYWKKSSDLRTKLIKEVKEENKKLKEKLEKYESRRSRKI